MTKQVVCISRALGAGGEEAAQQVAGELGYRYVNDEILARAAEMAGVPADEIAKAEHSQPLVSRIIEAMASVPVGLEGGFVTPAVGPAVAPAATTYSHLIEHVIRETAEAGSVVIVAHGASHPLAGRSDVLRVLVTGSVAARIRRLAEQGAVDEAAGRKALETSDRERARYLERFYKVQHELPTHYDLTLTTDALSPAAAAAVIVAAARA